jgi:hypothetical protein
MQPVRVEGTAEDYKILHRCTRCGHEKRNKVSPEDSRDALVALAAA